MLDVGDKKKKHDRMTSPTPIFPSYGLCRAILSFAVLLALSCRPVAATMEARREPLRLARGPHLLIDDFLIAEQSFLSRTVNQPA